jgi:hypothetical protein
MAPWPGEIGTRSEENVRKCRHRFPRINAANAAWRSGSGQGFLMLRREKRAQLVKNIIAESERVIEFGEHASIHTSRQSCSKAGKARIFALVWGVIRGIPVHNGIDRIGWSGADRPLLAMGTRPQGEGSP